MRTVTLLALLLASSVQASTNITWKRHQLHGDFYSEGAGIGDLNGDGQPDVVAGPFWWEGPAFEKRHTYYEPKTFNINGYSDNFFAYVHDFDADQKNDILILGFPGKEARLYLNPGVHDDKPWSMYIVADVVDNESPVFTDITGDGKPEIVCSTGGKFGWFAPHWDQPTQKWPFVAVTEDMGVAKFTHGLGVGDVNGDGRLDLLEAKRWWEAPKELGLLNEIPVVQRLFAPWTQHTFAAGIPGGAQMFAYDFDGNGTNDVFTTLAAHRYGIAVFLQNKPAPNQPTWTRVMLSSEQPQDNDYGIVISQPHAAHLADIDGDGIQDIVTGKRYWAHNGKDPGEQSGDRLLYWYQTKRDGKGGVDFVPHLIDANTGVGVDVQVGDLNDDKLPDVVVANKAGVFILTQQRSETTADLTPKKMYGPALMPQQQYAKGQSPQDALKNMQLHGGFKAELIAHEPDLVQPIAFTFDERGRIWVIEGNSYPKPREIGSGQDRILIFEDADGNGSYETRKIFCEGINLASGIELGFGGVWVGAAPYLMFIPDKDRNDQPDPPDPADPRPKVPCLNFTAYALLDGWGFQDTHETLNSFIWGPDGWLYGCHGVFTHSRVGKPGTPDAERQPINAGVWRYHPVWHQFEVFAHGTSNPWGLDYDQHGEWFVTACVIPHLYHIVPGGRYQRQAGQHFNEHTYDDIKTIADHAHYAGPLRPTIEFNKTTGAGFANDDTNALGGGHAHCGLAIYQSNQFPPTYRNQLIFGNLHGHRLVANYTDPKGSTFVGKHAADFMRANDMHFIPVTQKVGPDGSLYVSDWSDQQICHRNNVEYWDRSNGRLYRISYQGSANRTPALPQAPFDLTKETHDTLVKLAVQTENEWFSRMARRVLFEKKLAGADGDSLVSKRDAPATARGALRRLWLSSLLSPPSYLQPANVQAGPEERTTAQRIRLAASQPDFADTELGVLRDAAQRHPSPIVRRELASALQRLPIDHRQPLAAALLARAEDKDDPMIPLLIWYGIEPLVGANTGAGMELAKVSKMPKVTEFIYRRMASEPSGLQGLLKLASESSDATLQQNLLNAVLNAARNGSKVIAPTNWSSMREKVASALVEPHPDAAKAAATLLELEAHMGVESALKHYRDILTSKSLATAERETALRVLLQSRDTAASKALLAIISGDAPGTLQRKAIQALATLKDPETPSVLAAALPKLPPGDQPDAINTLASTREGAVALLKAVDGKRLAPSALSPFLIRQLSAFDDAEVNALIKSTWGDVNAPKADMAERVKKYRDLLTPDALAKGDLAKGKVLFNGICGACHKLFGEGQNLGPDITGSNRADLSYLLENVLDPNAVIGKDYQLNLFTMKDGRVLSGIVKEQSAAALKVAMMGGIEFTLPLEDIARREISKLSTMPEGLFDALKPDQVIDLVKYLQSNGSTAPEGAAPMPGALEGETLKAKASGGNVKPQKMSGFGSQWSGSSQLWWTGGKAGDKLTLTLPVKEAGRYTLRIALTSAHDYGIFSATLNGTPVVSEWDGYTSSGKVLHSGELDWGTHELQAGENELTLTLTGHHPSATPRLMVGVDYVRLEKK